MCHEARGSHGGGARIGDRIDFSSMGYKAFYDWKLPGNRGAPQRCDAVDRPIIRHLVLPPLLDIRVAHGNKVFDDLHIAPLAGDEQRCAAVGRARHDVLPHVSLVLLQAISQDVSQPRSRRHVFTLVHEIAK